MAGASSSRRLCRALGLRVADSQANFVWTTSRRTPRGRVVRGLAERGVLVRAGAALGRAARWGHLRHPEENDRFIAALSELLES